MADFRKWIYALAVVALLAGFTVPASAQAPPFTCSTSVTVTPIVRAEGYTERTGDIVLSCNGGVPTPPGQPVPQVNVTVFLNTNITSRITSGFVLNNPNNFNANYNDALLLVDEPNSPLRNPANPIMNCGSVTAGGLLNAADNGPSGPGVCNIIATSDPAHTYDGTPNGYGGTGVGAGFATATCGSLGLPAAGSYGCGRPNVFQGRQGAYQNPNQANAVVFLGVPIDPPGTTTNRVFRITNIRADAEGIGVSTTFTQTQIQANIAINGPTTMTISQPQAIVAYINRGLTVDVPTLGNARGGGATALRNRLDFIQCQDENPDLALATTGTQTASFSIPSYLGSEGANFVKGFDQSPLLRFTEGFASSWKTKNLAFTVGNPFSVVATAGNANYVSGSDNYVYNGNRNYPADISENVPGAVYNTESGFGYINTTTNRPPGSGGICDGAGNNTCQNPPPGFGFTPASQNQTLAAQGLPLTSSFGTGIANSGVVSNGTRLSVQYTNVPSGATIWVPPVLYLYRQGSTYTSLPFPNPTSATQGGVTGVMVLTTTDANGAGSFLQPTAPSGNGTGLNKVTVTGGSGQAVWEILYTDVFSLEVVDVPTVVAYQANPTQNLPTPSVTTQGVGGFAPWYTQPSAKQPQVLSGTGSPTGSLPIPRFIPGTAPKDLFLVNKCACNLLFPYVVSTAGFDTGIAIANSSLDPGNPNGEGFFAKPQNGTVTFYYYGTMANGGNVPPKQTSKSVPAGQVLTYVLSTGSTQWGLNGSGAGLIGYIITQAQFQYCHAFAYISAIGAGPLTPGTSEGYLGIVLDAPGLFRTNQIGENMAH